MRAGEMRKVEFSVGPASGDAPVERYKADVTLRQVQRRLVPAIDDAWVAENLPQFETLEGFRRSIAADLEAQSARVERQDRVRQVRSALAARLEGVGARRDVPAGQGIAGGSDLRRIGGAGKEP